MILMYNYNEPTHPLPLDKECQIKQDIPWRTSTHSSHYCCERWKRGRGLGSHSLQQTVKYKTKNKALMWIRTVIRSNLFCLWLI